MWKPFQMRACERVTGRRHSDCFQPEDGLRTILMVGSTQAQNEIRPVVYKFPSIPPFHTLLQIKAALALHRLPLEQGWLCSSLPHSRCRETHNSLLLGLCWFALALDSVGGMGLCSVNSEILALTLVGTISKQTELKITMTSWLSECQFASIWGCPTWRSPLT